MAYIDPGNYSTDVAAGASYQFKLLFIVLMSNIIAIYLQSLCIKLGTVTGMDLAQMCRASLPRWLNYFLYFMAEGAVSKHPSPLPDAFLTAYSQIIATDIAEVSDTRRTTIYYHVPLDCCLKWHLKFKRITLTLL